MSTTQPIKDICAAHSAGREQGLVIEEEDTLAAKEMANLIYVNDELRRAYVLGIEWGQAIRQRAIARDAANPLKALVDARRALADADISILFPGEGDVELASVADSITRMATALRMAHQEIAAAHQALDAAGVPHVMPRQASQN